MASPTRSLPWQPSNGWWLALFGVIKMSTAPMAPLARRLQEAGRLQLGQGGGAPGASLLGIAVWSHGPGGNTGSGGMNGAMFQMMPTHQLGSCSSASGPLRPAPPPNLTNSAACWSRGRCTAHQRHSSSSRPWGCRDCAASSASSWWCWPHGITIRFRHTGGATVVVDGAYSVGRYSAF